MRFWKQTSSGRIWWYLQGEEGATQFMGILMPDSLARFGADPDDPIAGAKAMGWVLTDAGWFAPMDLGWHSPKPLYQDQRPMGGCPLAIDPCYYDGSGMNAVAVSRAWAAANFDEGAIKQALEDHYHEVFGEEAL